MGKKVAVSKSSARRVSTKKVAARKTTRTAKKVAKPVKKKKSFPKVDVNELILNHRENGRKLARSILRRWRVRMLAEEIDSIVDLTLCEAAKRYCPEKGASFMTFLFYHLRGHLVRAVASAAQANNVYSLMGTQADEEAKEQEWTRCGEVGFHSLLPEHVALGQREVETPEHAILKKEEVQICRKAYRKLDELEQEVINRSFKNEQALVDIARTLGYSRCHISRVKKTALDRLRVMIQSSRDQESQSISNGLPAKVKVTARPTAKRRSRRRRVPTQHSLAAISSSRARVNSTFASAA